MRQGASEEAGADLGVKLDQPSSPGAQGLGAQMLGDAHERFVALGQRSTGYVVASHLSQERGVVDGVDARIDGREGGEVLDGALHEVTRPGDVQNPLVTAGLDGVPENRRLPGAGPPYHDAHGAV